MARSSLNPGSIGQSPKAFALSGVCIPHQLKTLPQHCPYASGRLNPEVYQKLGARAGSVLDGGVIRFGYFRLEVKAVRSSEPPPKADYCPELDTHAVLCTVRIGGCVVVPAVLVIVVEGNHGGANPERDVYRRSK